MNGESNSSDSGERRRFTGIALSECWVEVVLTLISLVYVTYRVMKLPLAPDEWGVLRSIYEHQFPDHFMARDWQDWNAQSQFLNLILSRICFDSFGFNEILRIRIPTLLSFGIFLYAIWQIRQQFTRRLVGRLAFVALLSNAFVLDYFGVSRGYGLAMAYATLSLAAVLAVRKGEERQAIRAVCWAALAVLSNFAMLPLYVAILLMGLFLMRHESYARLAWLASSALMLAVFYWPRVIVMHQHNLLYLGGNSGFVSDTVVSLVKCMFYEGSPFYPFSSSRLEMWLARAVVGLVIVSAIGLLRGGDRRGLRVCVCLFAIVAMIVTGHVLLRVRYPVERAAMYLIPLFVLQIAYFADGASRRWLRRGLSGLLLAYSATAVWGLNLTHVCVSKVMADIPALMQDLSVVHQHTGLPVVLCLSDGTKWQVWYYAELATKLPKDRRLNERGCYGQIRWLRFFETHCGLELDKGRLSTAATTHLFLSRDDYPPTWLQHQTGLVKEYPVSHWRLYARVGEPVPHDDATLQAEPDYADGHFSRATVLMQEERFSEAIEQYEQALRINPDYVDAHSNLGMALTRTGKPDEAIAQYEQALRIDPEFAAAHANLGVARARQGKIAEAIAQYEQALRINPEFAAAHYNLGVALAQTGKTNEAVASYQQAVRIDPEYTEAHYNLALVLAQIGRTREAIEQFEQTLRIQPNNADAHYNLGIVLAETGRIEEAVGHFHEALRIQPNLTLAQDALAQVQARP